MPFSEIDAHELARLHAEHVAQLSRGATEALARTGYDAIVIHSGSPQLRTRFDDNYWPLRPNPHVQHWLPLTEPGCALIVRPGARPRLLRMTASGFWDSPPRSDCDHCWSSFDVVEVPRPGLMVDLMPAGRVAFVGDDLAAAAQWNLTEVNPPALIDALDQLRVRKTAYEVACIAEANRRASVGHQAVHALFENGDRAELELHLAYLLATRQDDPETPYKNIVALGVHAATLHHVSYEKRASSAQSLLLDAGAAFAGYASDVTRTWVKGKGVAASAFAQLVTGVDRLQRALCDGARVGLPYESLHEESHRLVALALREAGISRLSQDELVSEGITRAFYPHGLGHSLGLVCHDVGCLTARPKAENPWLRNTTTIAADQCFTIEPGIYFIEALLAPLRGRKGLDWQLVDALAQLGGVRIEDDLLVTADGQRNFTREHLS